MKINSNIFYSDVIKQATLPEIVQNRIWTIRTFLCQGGEQTKAEILERKGSLKILEIENMEREGDSSATNAIDLDILPRYRSELYLQKGA